MKDLYLSNILLQMNYLRTLLSETNYVRVPLIKDCLFLQQSESEQATVLLVVNRGSLKTFDVIVSLLRFLYIFCRASGTSFDPFILVLRC